MGNGSSNGQVPGYQQQQQQQMHQQQQQVYAQKSQNSFRIILKYFCSNNSSNITASSRTTGAWVDILRDSTRTIPPILAEAASPPQPSTPLSGDSLITNRNSSSAVMICYENKLTMNL